MYSNKSFIQTYTGTTTYNELNKKRNPFLPHSSDEITESDNNSHQVGFTQNDMISIRTKFASLAENKKLQENKILTKVDVNRIVLDENTKFNPIQCIICKHICLDPVLIVCCANIACKDCVKLFDLKHPCPICYQLGLFIKPAGKIIKNILDKLELKCYFTDKGCDQIVSYSEIKKHEAYCTFNPDAMKECKSCQLFFSVEKFSTHSCLEELNKEIEQYTLELNKVTPKDSNGDLFARVRFSLRYDRLIYYIYYI
jgi:hypothetical protein